MDEETKSLCSQLTSEAQWNGAGNLILRARDTIEASQADNDALRVELAKATAKAERLERKSKRIIEEWTETETARFMYMGRENQDAADCAENWVKKQLLMIDHAAQPSGKS